MSAKGLEKLRTLFAQEAEQRLARLGQLVLELEQGDIGNLAELIAEVFREVHTLKGSAAVVGFDGVAAYAHEVEEKLAQLRSGVVPPTTPIVDALLIAVDRLGSLIWESVRGDDIDESANAVALDRLEGAFGSTRAADLPVTAVDSPLAIDVVPAGPDLVPAVAPVRAAAPAPARASVEAASRTERPSSGTRESAGTVMVPVERLDELVRMVGEAAAAHLRMGRVLTERIGVEASNISEFSELSRLLVGLQEGTMRTRMVPVSTITDSLQRAVRDAARSLGKDVRWEVRGEDTELDRGVLHQLADSLLHLVRNAVDHGVGTPDERAANGKPTQAVVRLHAMQLGSEVVIAVSDDGEGVDLERVRQRAVRSGIDVDGLTDDEITQLIFRSGFSTTEFVSDISGRGVGLDAVRSSVESARGRVEIRSTQGVGSEFRIVVPITLAVLRCLLVEIDGQRFALPSHRIALAQAEEATTLLHAEGRQMLQLNGQPVPISDLAEVLGIIPTTSPGTTGNGARSGSGTYVIVHGSLGQHAFLVDALVGQRDVVVKAFSALVPRLDVLAGASIEADGSILLVLDPPGLIERSRHGSSRRVDHNKAPTAPRRKGGRLLVVDDALTVRELQRTILERAGFDVTVANDGIEALAHLENEVFDLVLTDIEMPRMNGFELTEHIRAHATLSNVAILMLTSLASDTDRRRGMDVGADGYIVKSSFDEQSLLAAVDRLVGTSV
jgi:two-component system, chemotaxis family, sensor kinase CheA